MPKLDLAKKVWTFPTLCDPGLARLTSPEAAQQRSFTFHDLAHPDLIQVEVRGYTDFYGGYAQHTREILHRLTGTPGTRVRLERIASPGDIDPFENQYLKSLESTKFDSGKPWAALTIAGPGYLNFLTDSRADVRIGWTMLETRGIPQYVVDSCAAADYVWLPTVHDLQKFCAAGVPESKARVVHLGIDTKLYHPGVQELDVSNVRGKYVFMFVGSWNARKGVKEVLQAFYKAFQGNKDVALLLVSKYGTRPHGALEDDASRWTISREFQMYTEGLDLSKMPQVVVCDVPLHPNIMPALMARADCCVAASRGESTWLPGLEFGALGVPVIQSSWGGFREYLDEGNAILHAVGGFERCTDELVAGTSEYYEGQELAIIKVDRVAEAMRWAFDHPGEVQERARTLQAQVLADWDWEHSVKTVLSELRASTSRR